jgi:hypothetical protein
MKGKDFHVRKINCKLFVYKGLQIKDLGIKRLQVPEKD